MACELTCVHCKQLLVIERPRPGQLIRCSACAKVVPVPWAPLPGVAQAPPPVATAAAIGAPWHQVVNIRALALTTTAALTVVGGLVAGSAWWVRASAPMPVAPVKVRVNAPLALIETADRPLAQALASTSLDRQTLIGPPTEELADEQPVVEVKPEPALPRVLAPTEVLPCAVGEPVRILRVQQRDEKDLARQLRDVPQVRMEAPAAPSGRVTVAGRPTTTTQIFQVSAVLREWNGPAHVVPNMLAQRHDLQGLPFRMGKDCELEARDAVRMQYLSRQMRTLMMNASRGSGQIDPEKFKKALTPSGDKNADHIDVRDVGAIPCLMQMLQPEDALIRTTLVEQLTAIKQPKSSEALAKLALFDLSDKVRAQAIQSLSERPRSEVRQVLLGALRYPWAPVADHAAEALVALNDKEAIPSLKQLSNAADPTAATYDIQLRNWVVPEVVRINHLSNCVMCHAPSHSTSDSVRGRLPSQNEPLPPLTQYYEDTTGIFVRADITYLRQDFSVVQEVEKPGKWPGMQRFDFLVRQRPEKPEEAYYRTRKTADGNYPQRQAVLFALRELSK